MTSEDELAHDEVEPVERPETQYGVIPKLRFCNWTRRSHCLQNPKYHVDIRTQRTAVCGRKHIEAFNYLHMEWDGRIFNGQTFRSISNRAGLVTTWSNTSNGWTYFRADAL
ncbi:uncharacterized protein Z519_09246 [Cladophialophora bantiana CBS 173.52]|uniref:Uncharacterized protein n=1 Tax=Cladophialophora bantiana (strain ATCC 10958 / CBS 173.52 / CDC B-1940 / NIH 8579) TaxID=1442370 RepID=A0A0D2FTD9_CLAB1|nr:uncharacterized protein Z519_09246 [Cladophialophora bantiana CBS 173.52]KIW89817.1 hypothetical protein Z519_09246 [Cladophialophora bantiana CBS 173.52]